MPVIATQDLSCGYTLSLSAGHLRHQPDNYHWLDSPVKHASHCHSGPLNWGHDHSFRHIPTHVHISGSLDHGQSDQRVYHGASSGARSTGPQCQHLWHTGQVRHVVSVCLIRLFSLPELFLAHCVVKTESCILAAWYNTWLSLNGLQQV